ncbi:UDP-glucose/GDP-mannose dehydrogenase family protein [bacterium]|nr:UDP-glucose/GDP-mannose dehydrogenase family protein [bacterium]
MKITIVGTGYVGLVTGTCLADSGNDVTCLDVDEKKVAILKNGNVPFYEPGLEELVERNVKVGRLHFSSNTQEAIAAAEVVFLAVGTPPTATGSADLSALQAAVESIAQYLGKETVVITKSTVPVGTAANIEQRLLQATGRVCQVASNPEFLKEGAAIEDFQRPDRVVVGVAEKLRRLYLPFLRTERPFLVMTPESAEMTKYVANSLLATKISFINEVANLCERMEADVDDVRRGIGHDRRIGFSFLFPGVGYGGSCFPKDVQALAAMARERSSEFRILQAVHEANLKQKQVLGKKIEDFFEGDLAGRRIALWGLAFKPRTDDVRDAPSLELINMLLAAQVKIRVFDPEAMDNVRELYGSKLEYASSPLDAAADADALAIVTEWGDFRRPDFKAMQAVMASHVIFDGRNLFDRSEMLSSGFLYYSIGRPVVDGRSKGDSSG